MFYIIKDHNRDPLGKMLLDYFRGDEKVFLHVWSEMFDMWQMTGSTMFRSYDEMDELERYALNLCRGKVLDVGAGSGCHSLLLQEKGIDVDAIDISPGCVQVMEERGVLNACHENLFTLSKQQYDTILMIMNGMGICGSLDGCNIFLQYIKNILSENGQILADSTAIESAELNDSGYQGETEFVMQYRNIKSDPFDWIYIDYLTLESLVHYNNLKCEQLYSYDDGRYLVRIHR